MLKTETRDILGHKYVCSLFPAMHAYKLARKLFSVIVAPNNIDKLIEIDSDGELILELLSECIRDDLAINRATFDTIFTGNLKELVEALKFVIEVNFGDFFGEGGIGALTDQAKAAMTMTPSENLVTN